MPLSSFIDISSPENLHWLAICGSSIILSVASSIVPNYLESSLDERSHNRARLLNETTARVHIAYLIFLVALITSDDIDRGSSTFTMLVTLTLVLVFILILSIIVSGRTLSRINRYKNWKDETHKCDLKNNVCSTPIGGWLYCKVCFHNALMAGVVGVVCIWLCVSPSIIKHGKPEPPESTLLQNQRQKYFDHFQNVYKEIAAQTKEQFETKVLGVRDEKYWDPKLNVSYWINHEGTLHQLGYTEGHPTHMAFTLDKRSIIGCGFDHQNHSVQWDSISGKIVVVPFNEDPLFEDPDCHYAQEQQRKLRSIVCTSYNANGPSKTTVGICIFTESDRKIFVNNYLGFLRLKVEHFHKLISPALLDDEIVPH